MKIECALERCGMFGMKPGLESIGAICSRLGDPQDALRIVHVAGTNGKGATCALIESSFRAAGFSTGRYTSPHLVSLTERFMLNGAPVSEESLDDAYASLPGPEGLTYFELLTATAFELYRRKRVDWLVLETGLGGRLDATNIVKRPKVCIITRIGLDHCDRLGGTLREIAAEKGGIIKDGVPVVLGAMPAEAREVLERIAKERNAPCVYAPDSIKDCEIPSGFALGGKFNRENALTALAALKVLGVGRDAIERGFASVVWPGRFQKIARNDRHFIVDGAHNPPAMRALVDSLKEDEMPVNAVVCGFCGDKDVAANLELLREVTERGIAVPIRNPRSLSAEATAKLMRDVGFADVRLCESLEEALSMAPDGTVMCGSLFLAGEVLQLLNAAPCGAAGFTPNETFSAASCVQQGCDNATQKSR
ncbi:MAG: bifunctional folylpolyglutamate synthase/dihydrofolate synthase [Kiritimatiellae bacterium]|nr:bifunctional folylpolyglutamate synthase/dihydrofolate synthase [Kiritimatiellia bacterium]